MSVHTTDKRSSDWPVLKRYDHEHSLQVAMPIGGIGTGTVSLGGRGDLRDWEIVNRPAKGWAPKWSFFAIRLADPDGNVSARALEGPIDPVLFAGHGHGSAVANHGLPRFAESEFHAAYPFGQVMLTDPDLPVDVRMEAFNPLVPTDTDASGIPIAVLRYVVTNTSDAPLEVSVAGSLQNFIGTDGKSGEPKAGRNTNRRDGSLSGVFLTSDGVDTAAEQWGSLALAVRDEDDVSTRTSWAQRTWSGEFLDFWDDLTDDGHVDERTGTSDTPMATVVAKRTLQPGSSHTFTYTLTWHFPNRQAWHDGTGTVGNYYTTQYADAWDVAARTAPALGDLEEQTLGFVRSVTKSDLPEVVKEAALFNLSTLRSQTCFRTSDGRFFGWEGCNDDSGSCHGSCTHVWNYELVTPYLFGSLAQSMRDTDFVYATASNGQQSFRVAQPLDQDPRSAPYTAADGQMGSIVKLYREWRHSGDDDFLRALWPQARKALEFAWIPGGWDADRDGVMEGCQHNTMDVEYFGPNPEIGTWYLAALRAAEEMSRYLGDDDFAKTCADLFENGSTWIDGNLFNGDYYVHEIRPPGPDATIASGLQLFSGRAGNLDDPDMQVGDGCLSGQLVGQAAAHLTGLGELLGTDHVDTTLRSIVRFNRLDGLGNHFNPARSYLLGDEKGLLAAAYPHGNRPRQPFPYYAEVWTGLEYTAAISMFQAGQVAEGIAVVQDVRDRFDGRRRNPFDEVECGHHYVRAMAAWGAVVALTGFRYDGVTGTLEFAAVPTERLGQAEPVEARGRNRDNGHGAGADRPVTWFWSNGHAWGTVTQQPSDGKIDVEVEVQGGRLSLRTLLLAGVGSADVSQEGALTSGDRLTATITTG